MDYATIKLIIICIYSDKYLKSIDIVYFSLALYNHLSETMNPYIRL